MPNDAWPFPGTTKKLHSLCLLLCSTFTLHIPNWVIVVWLYIFSLIFVFLVAASVHLWSGSTYHIFHTSCHMPGIISVSGPDHSICTPSCRHFNSCGQFCFSLSTFIFLSHCVNIFISCKLLMTAAWALWASILFTQMNTHSLGSLIFSSLLVRSHMISGSISESFSIFWTVLLITYLLLYNCIPQLLS